MAILLKFREEKILEGEYIIFRPDTSEEVFWEYANEDANCELIDGMLVIHSPASVEHEDIFRYLITILGFYLEETQTGKVYGSRFVMRLSPRWNPEPNLFVITPEKYSRIKENYFKGPADIVIEILSKATRDLDLNKKLPEFLRAGVREVWIVDPEHKTLSIHSSSGSISWEDPKSEEIIKSQVLPNFPFQINWLWHREDYSVNKIIRKILDITQKESKNP